MGGNELRRPLAWMAAGAALALGALPGTAQAQVSVVSQGVHAGVLEVPINKSQVLRVDRPFAQALVGNAEIADVLPITNRSLYVLGKKTGTTSLMLYDRNKSLIAVMDVVVGPDTLGLRRQLSELIPGQPISVRTSNDSIILSGVVDSAPAVKRAVDIAETYAPGKIVNMMSVGSSQQVMLEVRFSEMKRGAAKDLSTGAMFSSNSGLFKGGFGSDVGVTPVPGFVPSPTIGAVAGATGILTGSFKLFGLNVDGLLDAMERKGVSTTLAEPTLVALSGDTASFLAGGEFPIPVLQSASGSVSATGQSQAQGITVEFKPFGVSLAFTPTVLDDGIINLVVAPEVSSIDKSASVTINGLVIPGLQTRRAKTTVELRDGESFAMAGLIRRDFEDTVRQVPILGSLPIIGTLFRSTDFQKEETELVIIVTPRLVKPIRPASAVKLPTDRVTPPEELDLFLNGRTDSAVSDNPIDPLAPGYKTRLPVGQNPVPDTGVDGPSGHILE
jgi:pilus assembly protein CpaC